MQRSSVNRHKYGLLLAMFAFLCVHPFAMTVVDIVEFDNEDQRQRYYVLIEELRCPKCQNQNLSGSNSQISQDLRREVRRLLRQNKTDQEIKAFLVARYGDFVLYKPPMKSSTAILWLLPNLLLLIAAAIVIYIARKSSRTSTTKNHDDHSAGQLTATEQQKIHALLDQSSQPEAIPLDASSNPREKSST